MIERIKQAKKSGNFGLLIRRLVVFALPAIVLFGAIGGNIVMSVFSPKPDEEEDVIKATPVVVAEAVAEPIQLTVTAQGEARPRTEVMLASQVTGRVTYISPDFIEGGAFEKGDVLLQLDPSEYKFRVTQAEAAVAQMQSRYASEKAEADIARREWERLGRGEGDPLALREPQLAEAGAMLASARASLNEAKLQLERATIIAPFDGRVRSQMTDLGAFVQPGAQLGEIFSTDVMEIALPLTDNELGELNLPIGFRETESNQGPEVRLSANVGGRLHEWEGRITRTDSGYDRETRVLFAYAEVADPYGAGADDGAPLAAGLFVTAAINGRQIDDAIVIPRAALRGEDRVYVARPDATLEIRTVSVASSDRRRAIITAGLEAGERVITSPIRGAADGVELEIAGPGGATGDAGGEEAEDDSDDSSSDADAATVAKATN